MILVFLCILGESVHLPFFLQPMMCGLLTSQENTDTLDTVLAQSRLRGVVLFPQSEYSGIKTEIKYLS